MLSGDIFWWPCDGMVFAFGTPIAPAAEAVGRETLCNMARHLVYGIHESIRTTMARR